MFERIVAEEGLTFLGWRKLFTDNSTLGEGAKRVEPAMFHAFVEAPYDDPDRFERKLFVVRKKFEKAIELSGLEDHKFFYFPSLSCRTLVYKGMLTPDQLGLYFADDLGDPALTSALAMVHSRFSTNTFPSWELAHPYRMISHNGEINTLRGNINWMRARETLFASDLYDEGDVPKLLPIIREGLSDTACLDNAVELLVKSGYPLAHAMMMLVPEAWENHETMSQAKRDFYRYHTCLMEAWDGPASITFTDGKAIAPVLDPASLQPQPLLGHEGRPRHHGLRGRRARRGPGGRREEGTARAGPDVPDRPRAGADRRRRGIEALHRHGPALRQVAGRAHGPAGRGPRGPARPRARPRDAPPPPAGLRLHPGGPEIHPRPDGFERRGGDRLDGDRHAAGRALRPGYGAGHDQSLRRVPRPSTR